MGRRNACLRLDGMQSGRLGARGGSDHRGHRVGADGISTMSTNQTENPRAQAPTLAAGISFWIKKFQKLVSVISWSGEREDVKTSLERIIQQLRIHLI